MTKEKERKDILTPLQAQREEARGLILKRWGELRSKYRKSVACRLIATEVACRFSLLSFWGEANVRNVINKFEKENG